MNLDEADIAEVLIRYKPNVNLADIDGNTPLHLAARHGTF